MKCAERNSFARTGDGWNNEIEQMACVIDENNTIIAVRKGKTHAEERTRSIGICRFTHKLRRKKIPLTPPSHTTLAYIECCVKNALVDCWRSHPARARCFVVAGCCACFFPCSVPVFIGCARCASGASHLLRLRPVPFRPKLGRVSHSTGARLGFTSRHGSSK